MAGKMLKLTDHEMRVLDMALEFYIRLGLAQFSEIATRLDLLQGDRIKPQRLERIRQLCEEMEELCLDDGRPWSLHDEDTSAYTLTAFGLEARMAGNTKNARWAARRIRERGAREPLDPQERQTPESNKGGDKNE
jgi:hypothetical protein